MRKLLAVVLIILAATASMSAKNTLETKAVERDKVTPQKPSRKLPIWVTFGTNLSSYPGEESEWKLGYSLGLTFSFKIYKKLSMSLPLSFNRINTALKDLEGQTIPIEPGMNVYKTLSDWQISADFFEVPLLITYKFFTMKSYDIDYVLGPGLALAIADYSQLVYTVTDEIIGISQDYPPLDPTTRELRSTLGIITGARFHFSRCYVSILYTLYLNNIKGINKLDDTSIYPYRGTKSIDNLNSLILKLSINLF